MNGCEFTDRCCVYEKHKDSFNWRWMIADFCRGPKLRECMVRYHYEVTDAEPLRWPAPTSGAR